MLVSALEDSASFVSLRCIANSNPPAAIKWFKDSAPVMVSNGNVLPVGYNRTQSNGTLVESEVRFEPIKREDAGLYSCRAVNVIGESAPASYRLDVQCESRPSPPRLNSAGAPTPGFGARCHSGRPAAKPYYRDAYLNWPGRVIILMSARLRRRVDECLTIVARPRASSRAELIFWREEGG